MCVDAFKIHIDRLRGGEVYPLDLPVPPDFLEAADGEIRFKQPVHVKGEAYVAEDDLVLHFTAICKAEMPCAICNEWAEVTVSIHDLYDGIPLDEIRGAIYDMTEWLREEIIVRIPYVAECGGNCPKREELKEFIKDAEEGYRPFADLKKLL